MKDKDIEEVFGDFLPDGYTPPNEGGNYMRFEQGENKFRILDKAILGWEYWNDTTEGRKPLRFRMDAQIPVAELDEPGDGKHFWAMPVYNYNAKRIQILEITQKSIQRTISALAKDKEWGSPLGYDLSVVRTGEGLQTEYEVIPSPPKVVAKEIKEAYDNMTINLEALFDGDDPFAE